MNTNCLKIRVEGRGGDIYFGSKITHNEQNETTTSPPEYETIAMWNFDTFPRASGIRRAFSIARRNNTVISIPKRVCIVLEH